MNCTIPVPVRDWRKKLRIYLMFGITGKFRLMNFQRNESFLKIYHFINQLSEIRYLHLSLPKIKLLWKKITKEIGANRNIIGKLLLLSVKANRLINFEESPKYHLYTVYWSLMFGSFRWFNEKNLKKQTGWVYYTW